MTNNSRWKCPKTGSVIDFKPTRENFKKFAKAHLGFAMMANAPKHIKVDGKSPFYPSVNMVPYNEK